MNFGFTYPYSDKTSMTPMFAKLLRLDINVNKFELWSEKGWEQII